MRQIPNRTEKREEADVYLIPVVRFDGFRFKEELKDLDKPWVLFDWCEQGWDWPAKISVQFGRNFMQHGNCRDIENPEWRKFDDFVRQNPPKARFHRELVRDDEGADTFPLDYLNWLPEKPMDTREDFLKRPLDVLFNWGRSSERRMALHGSIFQLAGAFGYDVISEWSHIPKAISEAPNARKWASIHAPHYARIDVREVQEFNRQARVNIVMGGAGRKTFRHGECCGDAVMAMEYDGLAWAYPWTTENNCLQFFGSEDAVGNICNLLMDHEGMWEIYINAMMNSRNYRPPEYMRRHVYNKIEKCL